MKKVIGQPEKIYGNSTTDSLSWWESSVCGASYGVKPLDSCQWRRSSLNFKHETVVSLRKKERNMEDFES